MKAPQYEPEFIFTISQVLFEMNCFFCTVPINPDSDPWAIHITFPGKPTNIVHPACLEQLGWSILNYVMAHSGNVEPEGVIN